MRFGRDFLGLQIRFAERAAVVTGVSFEHALFIYTALPIRFGVPFPDLVEAHPRWQRFLEQLHLERSDDLTEKAYGYQHQVLRDLEGTPPSRPQFGCFAFVYLSEQRIIRPHFGNRDSPNPGALSAARVGVRRGELRTMLGTIRSMHPEARTVLGRSWLYNLAAYRRLFPPAFTADLTVVPNQYHGLGLWGQFLDKHGDVKEHASTQLQEHFVAAATLDELDASFPFRVLQAEGDISAFYQFYGLE